MLTINAFIANKKHKTIINNWMIKTLMILVDECITLLAMRASASLSNRPPFDQIISWVLKIAFQLFPTTNAQYHHFYLYDPFRNIIVGCPLASLGHICSSSLYWLVTILKHTQIQRQYIPKCIIESYIIIWIHAPSDLINILFTHGVVS